MAVLSCIFAGAVLFANGIQDKSAGAKGPATVSITFATGDVTTKETIHTIVQNFNKSQNQYKLQENLSISQGAYLDSLKTLNASGQMPDIFECRDVPVFVRADMIEPLPQDLLGLFETTVPVYGTVYTAPFVAQYPHVILYNKTVFDKYGINQTPKTYADFLKICDDLKSHGVTPMAAGVADIWHIGFLYSYFFAQYVTHGDPNYISKVYSGKAKFDSPEMIDAMTKLQTLFQNGDMEKGFMSTKESQLVSLLVGEKAAMIYTGSWTISQIMEADPEFKLGFFPIPDDKGNILLQGGSTSQGWALTKTAAKDPAKKAAFSAFMKYFFSKEQYTYFLKTTNAFSTTKEHMVYETTPVMAEILKVSAANKKYLMWNIGVGENELPPSFRNWTYKKVQEMLMGQITPQQLVKAMDEEWAVETRDFNPTKLVKKAL